MNADFIARMEKEILNNSHKGDWNQWKPEAKDLITEIRYHVLKLKMEVGSSRPERVKEYAADVANLASKAFELADQISKEKCLPLTTLKKNYLNTQNFILVIPTKFLNNLKLSYEYNQTRSSTFLL